VNASQEFFMQHCRLPAINCVFISPTRFCVRLSASPKFSALDFCGQFKKNRKYGKRKGQDRFDVFGFNIFEQTMGGNYRQACGNRNFVIR
jgi:hypothetical protein